MVAVRNYRDSYNWGPPVVEMSLEQAFALASPDGTALVHWDRDVGGEHAFSIKRVFVCDPKSQPKVEPQRTQLHGTLEVTLHDGGFYRYLHTERWVMVKAAGGVTTMEFEALIKKYNPQEYRP